MIARAGPAASALEDGGPLREQGETLATFFPAAASAAVLLAGVETG